MSGLDAESASAPAPRFSVIIPTHESRDFVVRAVESVRAQSFTDFEIIVLDNGSTDGTGDALASLAERRLTYRWQEDSGLPADSRNKALALARGEWACFLDADDTWAPEKLDRVAAAIADDPGVGMVCHDVRMVDTDGAELKRRAYELDDRPLYEQLLYRGNFLTTSAMCVRRELIEAAGGFDTRPEYFTVEDYDLWLRLAEEGVRLAMIAEPLGDFTVHADSASSKLVRHYDALMRLFDDHAVALAADGRLDAEAALGRRTRARLAEARDLARTGKLAEAARVAAALPSERADFARKVRQAGRGSAG